jgi:hypothetical protein
LWSSSLNKNNSAVSNPNTLKSSRSCSCKPFHCSSIPLILGPLFQCSNVQCPLSIYHCPLLIIQCPLPIVNYPMSINQLYPLSIVQCPLSNIHYPLSIVNVHFQLSIACSPWSKDRSPTSNVQCPLSIVHCPH